MERQPSGWDKRWTRLLKTSLALEPSLNVDLQQAEAMKGCRPSICPCAPRPSAASEPQLHGTQLAAQSAFHSDSLFWMYEYIHIRHVRVSYGRLCRTFDFQSREPDVFPALDVYTNKPLLHSRAHKKERQNSRLVGQGLGAEAREWIQPKCIRLEHSQPKLQ